MKQLTPHHKAVELCSQDFKPSLKKQAAQALLPTPTYPGWLSLKKLFP